MRFVYFMLADAANSSDGKQNILGAAVREIRPTALPAAVPLSLVAHIIGNDDEYGEHRLLMTVDGPEGRQTVVDDPAVRMGGPTPSSAEPGLTVDVKLLLRFDRPGKRTLRARYGSKRADWSFVVEPADA